MSDVNRMLEPISRDLTKERLANLGRKDLLWLKKQLRKELHRRWVDGKEDRQRKFQGWVGLANFMAGVTWAMACRESLRKSKEHSPPGGKRPQSGEMWLPRELLYALRHEVKERGWSPLAASCWADVHSRLTPKVVTGPAGAVPSPDGVVQFKVRLVQENCATYYDPALEQRH